MSERPHGRAWTGRDILTERLSYEEIERVRTECERCLHGKHPAVQGAVLADLLAIWIKGHTPEIRQRVLLMHIKVVQEELDA